MSRFRILALGLLTLLAPLLLGALACAQYWYIRAGIRLHFHPRHYLELLILLCMVVCWSLLAFYVVHAHRNTCMPVDRRRFWIAALIVFNIFAMPAYWYRFIWKQVCRDF